MRIEDVLADLCLEWATQAEVNHRRVGQVDTFGECLSLFTKLVHIGCHITDNDSVDDRADGLEKERVHELISRGSRHYLTDRENVEGRVHHDEVLPNEIFISFEVALIRVFLIIVHEVHVLHPALSCDYEVEPDGA